MASVEETASMSTPATVDATAVTDTTPVPMPGVFSQDSNSEFFVRVRELCSFVIVNERGDPGRLAQQILNDMNA